MMIVYGLIWLACGVVGSGFLKASEDVSFPQFTSKREQREALGWWLAIAIAGPVTLLFGFLYTGFGQDGWSLSTNPKKPK